LLGYEKVGEGDNQIDPAWALTKRTLKRLGITPFETRAELS